MSFNFASVPQQKGCRWFVRHGARTNYERGFRSKQGASDWINAFGPRLDWRAGFVCRLRGDTADIEIVDRHGNLARS